MLTSRSSVAALVVLSLLGACDAGSDPAPTMRPPTPTETIADTNCPNAQRAVHAGRLGGELIGDVTGDGADDTVFLTRDSEAEPLCRDFLVVLGAGLAAATSVHEDREYSLPQPRLNSLVDIDVRPGAEIVVDLEQGASTQFVGVFAMREGIPHRVRLRGEGGLGDLFPYGGSVGHIEASDCGPEPGTVLVSVATPTRRGYEVIRSAFRLEGLELVPDRAASERIDLSAAEVQTLPEYRSPPFGNCPRS